MYSVICHLHRLTNLTRRHKRNQNLHLPLNLVTVTCHTNKHTPQIRSLNRKYYNFDKEMDKMMLSKQFKNRIFSNEEEEEEK